MYALNVYVRESIKIMYVYTMVLPYFKIKSL